MSYSVRSTQRVDYSAQASRQYYATPSRNTPQPRGSSSRNPYSPAPYQQQAHQAPTHPPGPLPFFVAPPGQTGADANTQALLTTYPSRLRTGVTGLIQPENITGGPKERELFLAELDKELFAPPSGGGTPRDSPAPYGPSRRAVTTTSGRRSRMVSYAEQGSDDDEEEEEEEEESDPEDPASDPEDGSYGGRGDTGGRRQRQRREPATHGDASKQGRLKKKRDEMDKGWTWLGDRCPGERVRSQRAMNTKHQYLSQEVLEAEAQKLEALIPITIDFDVPNPNPDLAGIKIKDRFLWNLNETHITSYQFSATFCEDTGIPVNPYARTVSDLIDAQIEEAQNASLVNVVDPEVSEEDIEWTDERAVDDIRDGAYAEEMAVRQWKEADCRIILNIYTHILRDRIEWDLSSPLPPTLFAKHYCTEIGLTGEAIPLVAHAIHEELLKHKRDCLELELFTHSHPDEQAKWEKSHGGPPRTTNRTGAKGLRGIWRDWWEREEFGPILVELSMEEMEKREMERTREARRLMRGVTGKRRR